MVSNFPLFNLKYQQHSYLDLDCGELSYFSLRQTVLMT